MMRKRETAKGNNTRTQVTSDSLCLTIFLFKSNCSSIHLLTTTIIGAARREVGVRLMVDINAFLEAAEATFEM